jgi:hypothetical protein
MEVLEKSSRCLNSKKNRGYFWVGWFFIADPDSGSGVDF